MQAAAGSSTSGAYVACKQQQNNVRASSGMEKRKQRAHKACGMSVHKACGMSVRWLPWTPIEQRYERHEGGGRA